MSHIGAHVLVPAASAFVPMRNLKVEDQETEIEAVCCRLNAGGLAVLNCRLLGTGKSLVRPETSEHYALMLRCEATGDEFEAQILVARRLAG